MPKSGIFQNEPTCSGPVDFFSTFLYNTEDYNCNSMRISMPIRLRGEIAGAASPEGFKSQGTGRWNGRVRGHSRPETGQLTEHALVHRSL